MNMHERSCIVNDMQMHRLRAFYIEMY